MKQKRALTTRGCSDPGGGRPDNLHGPFSASSGLASAQAAAPSWSYTGSLNCARFGSATLLPNGKVLVAGGCNDLRRPRYCGVVRSR